MGKGECSQDFSHDDLRNSQVLFGEKIEPLREEGDWSYIYAPEQGLFGYLRKEEYDAFREPTHVIASFDHALPFGSWHPDGRPLNQPFSREQLVKDVLGFIGMPYLWGGRANHQTAPIGSVDCSALIHLAYRAQGILIPRDSKPQCAFAKPCSKLLPGDMIYLGDPVTHVIMKIEDNLFIEAPETGKSVRLLRWNQDIWEDGDLLCFADREKRYLQHYRSIV